MKVLCYVCRTPIDKFPKDAKRCKRHFCTRACHDNQQAVDALLDGRRVVKTCRICEAAFTVPTSAVHKYSTCSRIQCREEAKKGGNNGNWRGGVTKPRKAAMSTSRYKRWRTAVFERDDYTCVMCHTRGGELNADHVVPWARNTHLRYEISNGRTLCVECHKTTYHLSLQRKLTDDQAIEAVKRITKGEPRAKVAEDFGVSVSLVSRIYNRTAYKHIKDLQH